METVPMIFLDPDIKHDTITLHYITVTDDEFGKANLHRERLLTCAASNINLPLLAALLSESTILVLDEYNRVKEMASGQISSVRRYMTLAEFTQLTGIKTKHLIDSLKNTGEE